jgi:hypothetical protein
MKIDDINTKGWDSDQGAERYSDQGVERYSDQGVERNSDQGAVAEQ